jgi:hypothetical protein
MASRFRQQSLSRSIKSASFNIRSSSTGSVHKRQGELREVAAWRQPPEKRELPREAKLVKLECELDRDSSAQNKLKTTVLQHLAPDARAATLPWLIYVAKKVFPGQWN